MTAGPSHPLLFHQDTKLHFTNTGSTPKPRLEISQCGQALSTMVRTLLHWERIFDHRLRSRFPLLRSDLTRWPKWISMGSLAVTDTPLVYTWSQISNICGGNSILCSPCSCKSCQPSLRAL